MPADPLFPAIELPLASLAGTGSGPARPEDEVVRLFDELRAPLLRYLLSLGVGTQDAEEVVQEVFLLLCQHLRNGKPRVNLRAWTFAVAHNLGLKSRQRTQRWAPPPAMDAIDSEPGPEERMASLQRQERLQAVVRALPEQDRFCLSLRAEGLSYREIGRVLGMSLGAVANSLARSLSRLERADNRKEACAPSE